MLNNTFRGDESVCKTSDPEVSTSSPAMAELAQESSSFFSHRPVGGELCREAQNPQFSCVLGIKSRALDLHFFKTAYETQANICALGSPQMKTFRFLVEHCLLTRNAAKEERIRRLNSTVPRSLQLRYALPQMYGFGQDAVWFPGPNIQA